MLVVTFLSFLLMMAWATMGLMAMPNLTMSAFYGYPDLESSLLVSAQGGCLPNISVEVSSPFYYYQSASMDALRRLREAEVNGTILDSVEQCSSFLHNSWHRIAARYYHFANHMRSSLAWTWDEHPEIRPILVQEDPLQTALIDRGIQIERCLQQVTSNTAWMSAPCLHDLLHDLRNDDRLWYAPDGREWDMRVSLLVYQQWAADHAVLSVVELRTLGVVYKDMCGAGMKTTEACTNARERLRQSMSGFKSSLAKQLGMFYKAVSILYPNPEWWGRRTATLDANPNSTSFLSCPRVEYMNAKGWVCKETWHKNVTQTSCTMPFIDGNGRCFVNLQHTIPSLAVAKSVCRATLSRIFSYHRNHVRHAVAAAYSRNLAPFYIHQKRLMGKLLEWYQRLLYP